MEGGGGLRQTERGQVGSQATHGLGVEGGGGLRQTEMGRPYYSYTVEFGAVYGMSLSSYMYNGVYCRTIIVNYEGCAEDTSIRTQSYVTDRLRWGDLTIHTLWNLGLCMACHCQVTCTMGCNVGQ